MESTKKKKSEETYRVKGEDVVKKIKAIIREGNVRRIMIKNREGRNLIDIPLTIGIVGIVFAPVLAAVGVIAALISECDIVVERNK
jgi:hypothetical protein